MRVAHPARERNNAAMPKMEPVGIDFLDVAPVVMSTDVDVPLSAEEIWPYLVDNARWMEWFVGCAACSGDPAVWTDAGQTRQITLKPLQVDEISVEVTPNARWAMTLTKTNLPFMKRMLEVVELHDVSEGDAARTKLKWIGAAEPFWFTKPLVPLLERKMSAVWGESFERLHTVITN